MSYGPVGNYRIYNVIRYEVEAILLHEALTPQSFIVWSPPSDDDRLTLTLDDYHEGKHKFYHYAIAKKEVGSGVTFSMSSEFSANSLHDLITALQDYNSPHYLHTSMDDSSPKSLDVENKLGESALSLLDDMLIFPNLMIYFQVPIESHYRPNTGKNIRPYASSTSPIPTTTDMDANLRYFSTFMRKSLPTQSHYHFNNLANRYQFDMRLTIHALVSKELGVKLQHDHPLIDIFGGGSLRRATTTRTIGHLKFPDLYYSIKGNRKMCNVLCGIRAALRKDFNAELRQENVNLCADLIGNIPISVDPTISTDDDRKQEKACASENSELEPTILRDVKLYEACLSNLPHIDESTSSRISQTRRSVSSSSLLASPTSPVTDWNVTTLSENDESEKPPQLINLQNLFHHRRSSSDSERIDSLIPPIRRSRQNSNASSGYDSSRRRRDITNSPSPAATTVDNSSGMNNSKRTLENDSLIDEVLPQDTILHFETLIRKGNFAKVYRAKMDGTTVAVKVIIQQNFDVREAKNALDMIHENIVQCFGIDVCPNKSCLIKLEYMDGGSLLDYLRNRDSLITKTLMKSWTQQIANGMKYLETEGLVHRDLAARNILLDKSKTNAKIGDFGLARKFDRNQSYEICTQLIIPMRWQSLEVFENWSDEQRVVFTIKNDVWSFGILLYEIYSLGKVPYKKMNYHEIYEYLKKGQRLVRPTHAKSDIYDLMKNCWLENPNSRPSFAQIHAELGNS